MRMSLLALAFAFMTVGPGWAQIPLRPMPETSVRLWPVASETHRYTPPACSDSALAERELAVGPVYDTLIVTDKPRLLQADKHHRERLGPEWMANPNPGRVDFSFIIDSLGQIEPCSWRTLYATSDEFEFQAWLFVRDLDYLPGTLNGRPVRVRITQDVIFHPLLTRTP